MALKVKLFLLQMKYLSILLISAICCSCSNVADNTSARSGNSIRTESGKFKPPPAGTILAADSMKIRDPLNTFYFAVKIVSNKHSNYGSYDVVAHYGPNEAKSAFSFPKEGRHIMPVLKKGKEPFTYIIGFYWDNDPHFYDYYQVSARKGEIMMKYIKAYSFQ